MRDFLSFNSMKSYSKAILGSKFANELDKQELGNFLSNLVATDNSRVFK